MKKILLNIFLAVIFVFGLSGCYTIIWSPDSEFPTQENFDNSSVYYIDNYYGPYYGWYDVPWWLDYVPPSTNPPHQRDTDTGRIRETDGGRGGSGEVPRVDPPSRNEDSGNNSGTNKGTSGNSNSGSTSRSSDSGSNNSARNNDGGRNSGGRR